MARPSSVEVPRPTSSIIIKLCSLADRKISAVSLISTKNVDCPRARLSEAPTRQNIRSTKPIFAFRAGTHEPMCAKNTISAFCRKYVLFPAIFGPVTTAKQPSDKEVLFGTNSPSGKCICTTGCLPSSISSTLPSAISGHTQLCSSAAFAKEAITSI